MNNYAQIALESRKKVLELVYKAGTSHIGSLMGCADIMAVLMEKVDFDKDKFVACKSWVAALLYYHLWRKGRITLEELDSYCIGDSKFVGLVEPVTKDIPFGIGSMGMGFPAAVGFALSKKLKGEEGTVYCLMSDGELNCGTTWEASLIAAHHKLDNLVVVIEMNGFQAMGKTEDVLRSYFPERGWVVTEVDGHDYDALERKSLFHKGFGQPHVILAKTTKGKGVSFMENNNLWHYAQVKDGDYKKAMDELCLNS